jgi:putative ABC transport system ATP-binding protein
MDLLRQLNEQEEQTIVLVTHDSTIGASAGRLLRMRDGRFAEDHDQRTAPAALATVG